LILVSPQLSDDANHDNFDSPESEVINNAGEVLKKPFTEISEQEYDRVFAVNAKAPFFVMQEALKILEDNGRIINIGTSLLAVTTGCK
jgi:NAD(P)-dependent dehydrogenase (short-subunit alcohol dehydrogenase family)